MDSPVQIGKPFFQGFSIRFPRHSIHPRYGPLFQALVAASESIDADMVEQGGEP
jgi:hypothetical protein